MVESKIYNEKNLKISIPLVIKPEDLSQTNYSILNSIRIKFIIFFFLILYKIRAKSIIFKNNTIPSNCLCRATYTCFHHGWIRMFLSSYWIVRSILLFIPPSTVKQRETFPQGWNFEHSWHLQFSFAIQQRLRDTKWRISDNRIMKEEREREIERKREREIAIVVRLI